MRMEVRLPLVEPEVYEELVVCPKCGGRRFKAHGVQGEEKAIRDPKWEEVKSFRQRCVRCGRKTRVYPRGVSRAQQSDRLKGITVLLYVLGLSYGAVSDFVGAIGSYVCRTTVYNNVQEAGKRARQRQGSTVREGKKRPVIGVDVTYVKVKGEQVGIEVAVDDESGELLGLDIIVSENSAEVLKTIQEVAEEVGAEVIVSDDHGAYKEAATEVGLKHQICCSHVKRNVDELVESIREQMQREEPVPEGVITTRDRLEEDLKLVQDLVGRRPAGATGELAALYQRYKAAPVPRKGQRHTVWYRTRTLITRLWDRWPNLTLDQQRDDLDGTNNTAERLIGWWIKERYRTMRGYKRPVSIRNVVTLTARMGARSGRYHMSELYT
jgi:transposase-like protein